MISQRQLLQRLVQSERRGGAQRLKEFREVVCCPDRGLEMPAPLKIPEKRPQKILPPQPPVLRPKKGRVFSMNEPIGGIVPRELATSILSAMSAQVRLLEKALDHCPEDVICDGDRMRAVEIIVKMFRAFRITPEFMQQLHNPTLLGRNDPLFQSLTQLTEPKKAGKTKRAKS